MKWLYPRSWTGYRPSDPNFYDNNYFLSTKHCSFVRSFMELSICSEYPFDRHSDISSRGWYGILIVPNMGNISSLAQYYVYNGVGLLELDESMKLWKCTDIKKLLRHLVKVKRSVEIIEKAVSSWLEIPVLFNGKAGYHARKGWESCQSLL